MWSLSWEKGLDYTRPTREYIHMKTALEWAERSMCSQYNRKVGAVITSHDMRRMLSIGYNGPGRDMPDNFCQTWRVQNANLNTGTLGDCEGSLSKCPCLHAEDNAISFVDSTIPDKRLFVTLQPCLICAQRIMNANIRTVYYLQPYRDKDGIQRLINAGIKVYAFDSSGRYSAAM